VAKIIPEDMIEQSALDLLHEEGYSQMDDGSNATDDIKNGVTGGVIESLTKSEICVLDAIRNDVNAGIGEIASVIGLSSRTVDRAVTGLKQKWIIVSDKSKRNGQWEIAKELSK
jgi:DNA-binding MarR family transcriptional regulator